VNIFLKKSKQTTTNKPQTTTQQTTTNKQTISGMVYFKDKKM